MWGQSIQSTDEMTHVAVATHSPEVLFSLQQCCTDPTLDHRTTPPTLDVACVVLHQAVQILDRISGSKRFLQRASHTKAKDSQCLVKSFANRSGCTGMVTVQRTGEALKLTFCKFCGVALPSVTQGASDAGVRGLGQVTQDVTTLVSLTALHQPGTTSSGGTAPMKAAPSSTAGPWS